MHVSIKLRPTVFAASLTLVVDFVSRLVKKTTIVLIKIEGYYQGFRGFELKIV
jgi:hypothetical protein